jgi:hypothetical protein
LETEIDPRCVSVTAYPSAVTIVSDFPDEGSVPAYVTVPDAGARTVSPAEPPTSMPRCWPPSYGWSGSNEKPWSTSPSVGQVQAPATGTSTRAARSAASRRRRTSKHHLCCLSG